MAAFSRVGAGGWRQGDDATAQARVGAGGWYQVFASGSPPPVISNGGFTVVSTTAADIEFDTDSLSDGDVYVRARIGGSQADEATIISEGTTQATGASNPQTVSMTGLTDSTPNYYFDCLQDGADGESNILTVGPVNLGASGPVIAVITRPYINMMGA